MRLALVRHGQTAWNHTGRLQGSSDIPLNDTGRADALGAAEALAHGGWETVVSSPLIRASETADIIAQRLGIRRWGNFPQLAERSFGSAEGLTSGEAAQRWPAAGISDIAADAIGLRFPTHGVPGVESIESVRTRGLAAIAQIARESGDRPTVVVCHGTLMRVVLSALAGFEVPRVANGAVHEIEFSISHVRDETLRGTA
ncbi:histidine phosphatase family protein [Cryobacterium sp. CG_9.6]|uniref:histidine phosphatase family protein n=1 Tax=Cryobacterium sp. CG_9.6 TaxID=2760710 RepID=UPI0024747FB9|nr:histidine phosphatase family protein [Cryobacterium sp. CG_9.6]MDH6236325.1 broad specificity phosphatase PhoE [Cryobacterium sp. CG_9.6]